MNLYCRQCPSDRFEIAAKFEGLETFYKCALCGSYEVYDRDEEAINDRPKGGKKVVERGKDKGLPESEKRDRAQGDLL